MVGFFRSSAVAVAFPSGIVSRAGLTIIDVQIRAAVTHLVSGLSSS